MRVLTETKRSLPVDFTFPGFSSVFLHPRWKHFKSHEKMYHLTSYSVGEPDDSTEFSMSERSMCWSCSAQNVHDGQKSLCGCCSFQKPPMAVIHTFYSSWITFFWLQHTIHARNYKCGNKTYNRLHCNRLHKLAARHTYCLFVSSSASFPL